jgi:predicted CXXCH cytochrome family protein
MNIRKVIAENPELHGPVAAKDCSSCHLPHGGDNFRLLVHEYPEKFYAPYDPENYALCFACHDSQIAADPTSTTLTEFRDGDRNLHYLHVNKTPSGRTCRACHEVHAAKQAHIIRDGVPYGSRGWVLKINFKQLPNGGQCEKTCHATREYDRTKTVAEQ